MRPTNEAAPLAVALQELGEVRDFLDAIPCFYRRSKEDSSGVLIGDVPSAASSLRQVLSGMRCGLEVIATPRPGDPNLRPEGAPLDPLEFIADALDDLDDLVRDLADLKFLYPGKEVGLPVIAVEEIVNILDWILFDLVIGLGFLPPRPCG